MKKIYILLLVLSAVNIEIYAQLGYAYYDKLIELKPVEKPVYYIQIRSQEYERNILDYFKERKGEQLDIIGEMPHNGLLISAKERPDTSLYYSSEVYADISGSELIIHSRIAIKIKDKKKIDNILKIYGNSLRLDTCLYNIYRFQCKLSTSKEVLILAQEINRLDDVEWCEPVKTSFFRHFNTYYSQQYYLNNTGQTGGITGIDINVLPAWQITRGNSDVVVAVIDDGIDLNHEDLSENILQGYTVSNSTGYGAPQNENNYNLKGHGTSCAGIIAAQNNNIGIVGISSGVKLLPVNIVPYETNSYGYSGFASDEQISDAIHWAYQRADILSCSWGGGAYSSNIASAISDARTLGRNGKGCVVVFASGNAVPYTDVTFPANLNGTIAVGAIDKNGIICNYSCRGLSLDLVAPSGNTNLQGDIVTTDRTGSNGYSLNNYTDKFGGTSAACPQVAGVAALMLSVMPSLTESQVRIILRNTAKDKGNTGFDTTYGYGLVDAGAAVKKTIMQNAYISGPSVICDSASYFVAGLANGLEVEWNVPYQNSVPYPIMTPSSTVNNLCVIRNTIHYPYKGKLNATIKKNGIVVGTLQKDFYSETSELYAYYSQEACYFYGVSHPAISSHSLSENTATFVHQGCMVEVESPYFKYFNSVGYNQNSLHPSYWSYNGNGIIHFTLPYQSGGVPFYIEVDGDGACHKHRYLFFAISGNGNINSNYSLQMTPNGNGYDISLVDSKNVESSVDYQDEAIQAKSSTANIKPADTDVLIEVYCGKTGRKNLSTRFVNEKGYHLDTTGWQSGIYVVRVVYNDIVLAEKIHIK